MPRYFFDVEDGLLTVDEQGTEIEDRDAVEVVALHRLLDIARFELMPPYGRSLAVIVRDKAGAKVYRTELTIQAKWLSEEDPKKQEAAEDAELDVFAAARILDVSPIDSGQVIAVEIEKTDGQRVAILLSRLICCDLQRKLRNAFDAQEPAEA